MLDAFEARLADLLADLLAGAPGFGLPRRTLPAAAPAAGVVPVVRIHAIESEAELGDDRPRLRRGAGGGALRRVLPLHGVVTLDLVGAASLSRTAWLAAADSALAALQGEAVRNGEAFADGSDRGFALSGFRFLGAAPPDPAEGLPRERLQFRFAFRGEFWPVQPEAEGPAIASIPTRVVTLPVTPPGPLSVRAGGAELIIPVALDLARLGAAPGHVLARLRGAAPPGSLEGSGEGVPPGYQGFALDEAGVARVVFRPTDSVAAPARADIEVAMPGATRRPIAALSVQVLP